jgi:hypothetical protein
MGQTATVVRQRREGVLKSIELKDAKKPVKRQPEELIQPIGEILLSVESTDDMALHSLRQYVAKLKPTPRQNSTDSGAQFLATGSGGQVELSRALSHSRGNFFEQDPIGFLGKVVSKHEFVKLVHEVMTEKPITEGDARLDIVEQLSNPSGRLNHGGVQ